MGQQQSSEKEKSSGSKAQHAEKEKKVNRRVSIHALSHGHGRATPADPSASKDNATAQPVSHTLEKPALQQYLQTSPEPTAKNGNKLDRTTSRNARDKKNGLEHRLKQPQASAPMAISPAGPMDVPVSRSRQDEFEEQGAHNQQRHYTPMSQTRPPRLPLPIADVAVPDSPTLMPVDRSNADVPVFETDDPLSAPERKVRRKSSMLSTTTQDEEELGDELQPFGTEATSQTIPTIIEWNQPGHKVYVTGTFANWEKKFRLHHRYVGGLSLFQCLNLLHDAIPNHFRPRRPRCHPHCPSSVLLRCPYLAIPPQPCPVSWLISKSRKDGRPGMFAVINLPPGTHHIKFIVDDQMVTSDELPTAVDFSNYLVNYIEISPEDISKTRRESNQMSGNKSVVYPAAQHPHLPEEQMDASSGAVTPGEDETHLEEPQPEEIPIGDFRQLTPQYLIDLEQPDYDPEYQTAFNLLESMPGPPSLPMFLGRSILNGNMPVKDDSSVLTLPNHTVLNHLMTSSVRNGVLSTSVTTRYKYKVSCPSFPKNPSC